MKTPVYVIIAFAAILNTEAHGQSGELADLVTDLKEVVVPVQTGSKSYEPEITFAEPAILRYSYVEADQKGKKDNYTYEFNLSDIDPYAVREHTQKDKISTILAVRGKQKLVKVYKNEEVQSYTNEVSILATDIENARAISEAIKKGIAPAEKIMTERLKLTGYDAMLEWLTGNVKTVQLGSDGYNQSLVKGDRIGTMRLSVTESGSKSSSEELFSFNLADININSINYKITGNKFAIRFETNQKAKYIGVSKDGQVKPYTDDITIATNNVDEARDLKTVLTLAVPLAVEKLKADMSASASGTNALQMLGTLTKDITTGTKQITQELTAQCSCTLTQIEKDDKGSKKSVYTFNWIDVNPLASKINVTSDRLFVTLSMNDGNKLIMHSEDGQFSGYEKDLKFYMPGVETARRTMFALSKAVETCKASYKDPFAEDLPSLTAWIMNNVKDATVEDVTMKQTLEPAEQGQHNKLKYTVREMNSKGTGAEEVYEFNVSDINPQTVELEVKGKWLYVTMETAFKGKIIKYYKDGKIQPYASRVSFVMQDVDASRDMVSALKKTVKLLKSE